MTILDDLLKSLNTDVPVRSVLVGAHWTVVCSRYCGMATSLMSSHPHEHAQVRDAGRLHEKSARELAQLAYSDEMLEASIGVATINSLLEVDESLSVEINASEVLISRGRGKNVALVGHFPFIPQLRQNAAKLWVIEQADVVAITGSALVNLTLDYLLALCRPEVDVMVLGPSTPLSPVLFDHGATIISGTRVVDEAAVLRTVGQGASFRQVGGNITS